MIIIFSYDDQRAHVLTLSRTVSAGDTAVNSYQNDATGILTRTVMLEARQKLSSLRSVQAPAVSNRPYQVTVCFPAHDDMMTNSDRTDQENPVLLQGERRIIN